LDTLLIRIGKYQCRIHRGYDTSSILKYRGFTDFDPKIRTFWVFEGEGKENGVWSMD